MDAPTPRGFYVTGTDTDAGKTLVSVALLRAFSASGASVAGMKPVASGCDATTQGLRNADALALQAASVPQPRYEAVNPFALVAATAPQIAAALDGRQVTFGPMMTAYEELARSASVVVVEGVGGWMAPFADGLEQAQLARALDLSIILVVGMKLGCLNHARLTARAIADDGLNLVGWVANAASPELEFGERYVHLVEQAMPVPCLGVLPYAPGRDAASFAPLLRLPVDRS